MLEDPIANRLSASPQNINQSKDVYIPYDRPPVQVTSKEVSFDAFYFFHLLFSVTLVAKDLSFSTLANAAIESLFWNICIGSSWYYTSLIWFTSHASVYVEIVSHLVNQWKTQDLNI